METIIEIDKKYDEDMPLEKKTEFLFEYKSKLHDNTLDDNYHTLKRNLGFAWFDRMLKDCQKGNCPRYFSNDIFYALTDISLEGYALQKAHHFLGAEVGTSDKERYFKAIGKIDNVLTCYGTMWCLIFAASAPPTCDRKHVSTGKSIRT